MARLRRARGQRQSEAKSSNEQEQVHRVFDVLEYPYTAIESMPPRHPDVRVTTPSGRLAVEVTEVHWGVGPRGGSQTRRPEDSAIRAALPFGGYVPTDPTPSIVQAIDGKCGKSYVLDADEDPWLLLVGGSSAAPVSTAIVTMFLDLARLSILTHGRLARSVFSRCYLFCELTERGRVLYQWNCESSWQQVFPTPVALDPQPPVPRKPLPMFCRPVPLYVV
jgi:hypothetical protein